MSINEGIGLDNQNKGSLEIKENKLDYYTDIYSPGQTKQRLKVGREVEGGAGGGVKMLQFTRLASVGTGLQTFSGFGFKPTSYYIFAWRKGDVTGAGTVLLCTSQGKYNELTLKTRPNGVGQIEIASTTSAISIDYRDYGGSNTVATHSSFNSDGISLNFTASNEDIILQITAYQ